MPIEHMPISCMVSAYTSCRYLGCLGLSLALCVDLGFLVWLRFALRSLAVWRVRAIAPSFIFGRRAFTSVSLCNAYRRRSSTLVHRSVLPCLAAPERMDIVAINRLSSTRGPSCGIHDLANVSPSRFCMPREMEAVHV
jgi:hypothetical protein